MAEKEQVLIISRAKDARAALQEALTALTLDSCVCRPEDAGRMCAATNPAGAVLVVEKLAELGDAELRRLTSQLDELAINALVLTDQVNEKIGNSHLAARAGLFFCGRDESAQMLKGRLATLVQMRGTWQRLTSELAGLRRVNQPLNQHFAHVSEEMHLASRLQRDFLPGELPQVPGVRLATVFRPASWVSGDIYDVMRLDEEHIGFYVADAVGHGMPAALLTMFVKQGLVTKRIEGHNYTIIEPNDALAQLNEDMVAQGLSNNQFVTCCYGILNVVTLRLRIASAGHPPPMYINQRSEVSELSVAGRLLGVFPGQKYQCREFQLERGDKLLVYSDGVEVAFEQIGPDQVPRFPKEFGDLAAYDVETMSQKLVEIIERREGSLHPRDDVTIVAIQVNE